MSSQAYNDGKFLLTWSIMSLLTFALPMVVFGGARLANSEEGGAQEANDEYQEYQAAQGQASYNNYATSCSWWQWNCDDNYQAQDANEREDHSPWWWLWAEDERRNENQVSPTIVVIYVWHLIMLWAVTLYGRRSVVGGGSLYGVSATCLMFANYSFVSMLFIGSLEGAVFDDASILDENGWYGQFGVLLYMTMFTSVIFGISYFFGFRRLASEKETTKIEVAPQDYVSYDEPAKPEEGGQTA